MQLRLAGLMFGVVIVSACSDTGRSPDKSEWFEPLEDTGLDFVYRTGASDQYRIPEIMGGGGTLLDFDNDGRLDIYLVQGGDPEKGGEPNQLYRNLGNFRFEKVTAARGAADKGYGMGATAGDYDGDGDEDLYVTNLEHNVLLRNDGEGAFSDVTEQAGVAAPGWSTATGFLDYNGDGHLDLFVVTYLDWEPAAEPKCFGRSSQREYCGPATYGSPQHDLLFRNEGDGTFTDVSVETGIASETGNGLGLAIDDFDGDGDLDIFVANDTNPDRLWVNEGDKFVDRGRALGVARDLDGKAKAGMGVGVGDLNRDARPDLLVVNLFQESDSLLVNKGAFYNDVTRSAGLGPSSAYTRFGAGFADFNNDGSRDIFEVNGKIDRQHGRIWISDSEGDPYAEPNLLYEGAGVEFTRVHRAGLADSMIATSRGALFGDFDNDGGVDLLVVDRDAPVKLLRNVRESNGHWVSLDVRTSHNSVALGAIVLVDAGDQRFRGAVRPVYSYLAGNDPRVHLGLGDMEQIERVEVVWASGDREIFGPLEVNRVHRIVQSRGRTVTED